MNLKKFFQPAMANNVCIHVSLHILFYRPATRT